MKNFICNIFNRINILNYKLSFTGAKEGLKHSDNLNNIHSFTYFIPAPPEKKISHREKKFDKVFFEYINQGHEIIDINMQAIDKGLWLTILSKSPLPIDLEQTYIPEMEFELDETI